MAIQYDPAIIYRFADRLYSRGTLIEVMYAIAGLGVGALSGALAAASLGSSGVIGGLCGAFVGAGFGGMLGDERAFVLKLQAQQALCQVKIEENTRYVAQAQRPTVPQPATAAPYAMPQASAYPAVPGR